MSNNYNSTLQSNNTDLQEVLQTLQTKAAGGKDPVLQDKTVSPTTSQQTITADSGYDGLSKVTVNAMPTATQATPSITVNSSGLITATTTQTAGYVAAGSKSATKQLAFQPAKTIRPSTTNQIAVSSGYYTGGNITVQGDANLVAGNIKSGVSIFGVSGTYEGSGGDTSTEDNLVTRTISNYTNNRVPTIGDYAFYKCHSLISASFPKATTIGDYAFYSCYSLISASFPAATIICSYAFTGCTSLISASFPKATTICNYAFTGCTSLISVSFPKATTICKCAFNGCSSLISANFPAATTIGSNAFDFCTKLASVNFPAATTIGSSAFCDCSGLTSASFPAATTICDYAFTGCTSLISASFPKATTIGSNAFSDCYNLATVSFPVVTSISSNAFKRCYNLKSLYLTGSSVCKLSASNAFSSTPIGGYSTSVGTYGSIYVPASLLASYKTATNWTYFSSRFVGI